MAAPDQGKPEIEVSGEVASYEGRRSEPGGRREVRFALSEDASGDSLADNESPRFAFPDVEKSGPATNGRKAGSVCSVCSAGSIPSTGSGSAWAQTLGYSRRFLDRRSPSGEQACDFEPSVEGHLRHLHTTPAMELGRPGVSSPTAAEDREAKLEIQMELLERQLKTSFDVWLAGIRSMQKEFLRNSDPSSVIMPLDPGQPNVAMINLYSALGGGRLGSGAETQGLPWAARKMRSSLTSGSSGSGAFRTRTYSRVSVADKEKVRHHDFDGDDKLRMDEARKKCEDAGADGNGNSASRAGPRTLPQKLVASTAFQLSILFMIATNAAIVGIEVDHDSPDATGHFSAFKIIDLVYTSFFFLEIVLRICAESTWFFLSKRNRIWNVFDLLVVAFSLAEACVGLMATTGAIDVAQSRALRVVRVSRLLRTFRMVRVAKSVRSLQTLLHSIAVTMKSLVWVVLLILMIFYGFGIAFTQATRDHLESGVALDIPQGMPGKLKFFWGTLPRSMFTLFMAIAGGISWHDVVLPLSDVGGFWVMLFCIFIVVSVFAILNVVTGVFCQSAVESAQNDKDLATAELMANKDSFRDQMRSLFDEIDSDGSGVITLDELEVKLEEDKSLAYLASLGIESDGVWTLFKLLDMDGSGTVDKEEFICGCAKLKGDAKAVHIAKLSYDQHILIHTLDEFMDNVNARLAQLQRATLETKRAAKSVPAVVAPGRRR